MEDPDSLKFQSLINELDTFVHEPVRLGLLMLLKIHRSMPFSEIQKALGVTSGNLNSHVKKLLEKKYIEIQKLFVELRPRTVIFLTKDGNLAILHYTRKFHEIISSLDE